MLRKTFSRTSKGIYASLMLSGNSNSHLTEIDQTSRESVERTLADMARFKA
jgi:hypothetical protein